MQTLTDFLQRAWKVRRLRITEYQLRSEMLLDGLDDINKNGINSPLGKDPVGICRQVSVFRGGILFWSYLSRFLIRVLLLYPNRRS